MTLVPPYNNPDIMRGQATAGIEIMEESSPAAIFVPVGGGGLITGIALAAKQMDAKVRIIGVEPEWEKDGYDSFYSHTLVHETKLSKSIADAVRIPSIGDIVFPLLCTYVDEIITVSEEQIALATLYSFYMQHITLEPSGALALAGALIYDGKLSSVKKPLVLFASGGNTTPHFLNSLSHKYYEPFEAMLRRSMKAV